MVIPFINSTISKSTSLATLQQWCYRAIGITEVQRQNFKDGCMLVSLAHKVYNVRMLWLDAEIQSRPLYSLALYSLGRVAHCMNIMIGKCQMMMKNKQNWSEDRFEPKTKKITHCPWLNRLFNLNKHKCTFNLYSKNMLFQIWLFN